MNSTEATLLLRKVRAYRPAMVIDEFTGDAWAEALEQIRYADASQAVTDLARRTSDWIDPAMVITEVRRIRAERTRAHGNPIPPAGLSVEGEVAWIRDAYRRIGDGEDVPGRGVHHELDATPRYAGSLASTSETVARVRALVRPGPIRTNRQPEPDQEAASA